MTDVRARTTRRIGPYLFGWPIWISIGIHGVAIATAASVVTLRPSTPPPESVPIEVVSLEAPAPPKPVRRDPIVPPRLVTEPTKVIEQAPATPALLDETPRRERAASAEEPLDAGRRFLAGASSSGFAMPRPSASSAKGSGTLFSTGDLPIAGGGSATKAEGPRVASIGNPDGLTSFARPVGGYQTRPRYPDSARRQGIEGETLLRFQVLASGRVAAVSVARSAGHPDLDRSAVDAVQTWRFEPARRGKEAVAVWVTLPVRFQLQSGVGD